MIRLSRLSLGFLLLFAACAQSSHTDGPAIASAIGDPSELAGEWRISGQMASRSFSFEGSMTLQVEGEHVTGQFRMRTPSPRVGDLGGSYKDGYLILNGYQASVAANDCRGFVNIRVYGAGPRMSGQIEMSDGCSNRAINGSIRMRRQ